MTTTQSDHARQLLVKILMYPSELDMGAWYRRTACGTTACLAGHSALLMGWEPLPMIPNPDDPSVSLSFVFRHPDVSEARDAEALGRDFLDLDEETSALLFLECGTTEAVLILDKAAQGEPITQDLILEVSDSSDRYEPLEEMIERLQGSYNVIPV